MRRLLSSTVVAGVLTPVLLALPVTTSPAAARTHPVRSSAAELSLLPLAVPGRHVGSVLAAATPATVAPFQTIGASWDPGAVSAGQQVEVRTRVAGRWSGWHALEVMDTAADRGARDDRAAAALGHRVVAEPAYVGHADGVQARVRVVRGVAIDAPVPSSLRVVLVSPGTSAADSAPRPVVPASSAFAEAAQPLVRSRADWGADESLRSYNSGCGTPDYSSTVKVGFVHHTDTQNDYAASDVPAMIRSIYAYHVKTQGWCDIGYNFLVDRFGTIWEGRYGGIDRPVIGAHTGGFNVNSFAASMLGTYATLTPNDAMISAYQHLYAWKLGLHYRDPLGTAVLTSAGGGTAKYAAGTQVTFKVISGHRDAGYTSCPGDAAYAQLDRIRTGTRDLLGAGLVDPATTATSSTYGGTGPTVTARVLKTQSWRLELRRRADATVLRSWTGSTASSLSQSVDLRDAGGQPLPVDGYTLVLSSAAGADPARSWTSAYDITAPAPQPSPSTAGSATGTTPLPGDFVAVTPTRLLNTRTGQGQGGVKAPVGPQGHVDVQVTGQAGIPTTGVYAVSVNVAGINAPTATFLTAFAAGTAQPGTSTVNLAAGASRAALAQVPVGPDGKVSVANQFGSTDVILDVVGYYRSDAEGSRYHPVGPTRLLNTRIAPSTRVGAGTWRTVQVAGRAGIPATATAVTVNVTAVRAPGAGYLTVAPAPTSPGATSTVNFAAGQIVDNRTITGLSNGSLSVLAGASDADVIVDVVGWFGPADPSDTSGARFTALPASRVLDTRPSSAIGPQSTRTALVAGQGGVPTDAKAVVLTLIALRATSETYLTAWGAGGKPATSDLNLPVAANVANLTVVPMAADGTVSIYNNAGSTQVLAAVVGYYR